MRGLDKLRAKEENGSNRYAICGRRLGEEGERRGMCRCVFSLPGGRVLDRESSTSRPASVGGLTKMSPRVQAERGRGREDAEDVIMGA